MEGGGEAYLQAFWQVQAIVDEVSVVVGCWVGMWWWWSGRGGAGVWEREEACGGCFILPGGG